MIPHFLIPTFISFVSHQSVTRSLNSIAAGRSGVSHADPRNVGRYHSFLEDVARMIPGRHAGRHSKLVGTEKSARLLGKNHRLSCFEDVARVVRGPDFCSAP